MIKLFLNGKDKLVSNKKGIEILRRNNPKDKFKITVCTRTGKKVIMQYEKGYKESNGHPNWFCLHD